MGTHADALGSGMSRGIRRASYGRLVCAVPLPLPLQQLRLCATVGGRGAGCLRIVVVVVVVVVAVVSSPPPLHLSFSLSTKNEKLSHVPLELGSSGRDWGSQAGIEAAPPRLAGGCWARCGSGVGKEK